MGNSASNKMASCQGLQSQCRPLPMAAAAWLLLSVPTPGSSQQRSPPVPPHQCLPRPSPGALQFTALETVEHISNYRELTGLGLKWATKCDNQDSSCGLASLELRHGVANKFCEFFFFLTVFGKSTREDLTL